MLGLQSNAAEVFQQVSQEYSKAHTGGTVDDAVVEGQAQWAHQARSEFFAVPNRLIWDLHTPKIATSGAFTIGVKPVPPIPPKLEW